MILSSEGQVSARAPADGDVDLHAPALYLNRELTWLAFNRRVLHEAEDERTPLLERLKFLAITASNLDEFFMKRIGGLKQQVAAGFRGPTVDGRTPAQQIAECHAEIRAQELRQRELLRDLLDRLAPAGIQVVAHADLSPTEQRTVRDQYW